MEAGVNLALAGFCFIGLPTIVYIWSAVIKGSR